MGFIAEASDSMSQAKVAPTSKIIRRTPTSDENVVPRSRKGIATILCAGMAMYHGVVVAAMQSHNCGSLAGGYNCIRTIIIRHEQKASATRTRSDYDPLFVFVTTQFGTDMPTSPGPIRRFN
jgi:hypothetical protein